MSKYVFLIASKFATKIESTDDLTVLLILFK